MRGSRRGAEIGDHGLFAVSEGSVADLARRAGGGAGREASDEGELEMDARAD